MGAEAYDILSDKLSPEKRSTKRYKQLIEIMTKHFCPEPLEIAENYRFHLRRQFRLSPKEIDVTLQVGELPVNGAKKSAGFRIKKREDSKSITGNQRFNPGSRSGNCIRHGTFREGRCFPANTSQYSNYRSH